MSPLGELWQAVKSAATLLLLFIPSADREGNALGKKDQSRWVRKALRLVGQQLGGATAFPLGWGVWRDDAQGARLVWDNPILIQCFTNEEALRRERDPLRDFLMALGTETNQRAAAFVIDRSYYEMQFPLAGA